MAYSALCNATMVFPDLDWCLKRRTPNYLVICYNKTLTHDRGLWQVANAMDSSLPLFVLQLVTILVMNRLLMLAFRPFGLPRISAEILGGVILGPSFIGSTKVGTIYLFPFKSMLTLETIGNLSLIYYMFLVGLEVDIKPVMRAGKKPLSIALVSLVIPIPIGYSLHSMMNNEPYSNDDLYGTRPRYGPIFWGIALATTNFPDLARILSDLKLLHSEVGRIALSSAVITDLFSWVLLVVAIATTSDGEAFTIVSTIIFVAMCFLAVRPVLGWLISLTSKDIDKFVEYHICFVLASVPLFGFITDSMGSQSILGAFMLGVIMPKGQLKSILMDKVEDFVSGLLMPLFFLIIGLRTNPVKFSNVPGSITVITYIIILILAFCTKIISTFIASVCLNRMSPRDGLALGFLMNTKGLLALIIISVGRDLKALNSEAFTVMLSAIWVMTTVVGPILARFYKPSRQLGKYKQRTIISVEQECSELRILTCVHNPRNISSFVNIIEASNPTVEMPISVSVVHLVENTGRHAAMLIVHDTCHPDEDDSKELPQNHIMNSFENLKSRIDRGITVRELTAVSSYSTVHEDICGLAEDKTISLIIVPFHKQTSLAVEGGTDNDANNPFRDVNKNVMDSAQCSVAVFVDRGLSTLEYCEGEGDDRRHFYMVFIGGADDREALAYAWRMSNNSKTDLTVIRFVPSEDTILDRSIGNEDDDDHHHHHHDDDQDGIEEDILTDLDKPIDDDCIKEFKLKWRNSLWVEFVEHVVSNGDEMVRMIGSLDHKGDLFIVGRGKKRSSVLTKGLSELSECPELGALGDILVSSSFMAETSILIVQQGATSSEEDDDKAAASGGQLKEHIGRMTWEVPEVQSPEFAPFVHRTGRHVNHDNHHL